LRFPLLAHKSDALVHAFDTAASPSGRANAPSIGMRVLFSVVSVFVSVASALIPASEVAAATPGLQPIPPVIEGRARAVDGDTLDISTASGTYRVRLQAIDAAEGGQRCNLRWIGTWDCGRAATIALEQLVADQHVSCRTEGSDRYGRVLAVCSAAGRDVNAELVRAGLAWAYVQYSTRYVAEEQEARAARLGIWQGNTMAPWDWRAAQRAGAVNTVEPTTRSSLLALPRTAAASDGAQPVGCDIKGNVTPNGRIYHTRESPWYERIRMSLGAGRRWFCTEAEAREAGWRAAGDVSRVAAQ
jgi:endonuclease YncB( thermonuclease family)